MWQNSLEAAIIIYSINLSFMIQYIFQYSSPSVQCTSFVSTTTFYFYTLGYIVVPWNSQDSRGAPITNPVNQCRYSWTLNSLRAHVAKRVLARLSRVAAISPVNIYMQGISRCHLFHSAYLATDNHSIKTLQNYKLSGN